MYVSHHYPGPYVTGTVNMAGAGSNVVKKEDVVLIVLSPAVKHTSTHARKTVLKHSGIFI
jgi:hypothetical protein